ncbi:hypothetical protein ACE6H2_018884 [Prunus campanulata]
MCLFSFSSIVVNFVMHRGLANRHPLAQFREQKCTYYRTISHSRISKSCIAREM